MPPAMTESAETLRRMAATAKVVVRGLEVSGKASHRLARVEHRRNGFWVVFQPRMLDAPEPARRFVLAHEVAHIALGHRMIRRRLGFVLVAAILFVAIGFFAVLGPQVVNDTSPWLLLIESVIFIAAMLSPRAVILFVARKGEYQADRMAVSLLGSLDPGVAFFDWVATLKPYTMPFPLRLWGSTHPSNVARRRALLAGAR
jgi:Zn-dependent protease with chaperone function